ncbi:MAG: RrF2 family transcriptional regulator [Ferrimicrobium sp.]
MNLSLSRRGDYSVRAALFLARRYADDDGLTKIKEIVAGMDIPVSFAGQILADLVRAGLVSSKAGRDGGYRLSLAPEGITLLEVVEAGEGRVHADRCALGDGPCRWNLVCPLHTAWQSTVAVVRNQLASVTLANVVEEDRAIESGRPNPPDSHRPSAVVASFDDNIEVEADQDSAQRRLLHLEESEVIDLVESSVGIAMDGSNKLLAHPSMSAFLREEAMVIVETLEGSGDPVRIEIRLDFDFIDISRSRLNARVSIRAHHGTPLPRLIVRSLLRGLARMIEEHPH